MSVKCERAEVGKNKSRLAAQKHGIVTTNLEEEIKNIIKQEDKGKFLTQIIIRNSWNGGRICPPPIDNDQRPLHAATSQREESLGGLRARLVQKLQGTKLGKIVDGEHPNLLENALRFTNKFIGDNRFKDIQIGEGDLLNLVRDNNIVQPWDSLSGGEQTAFKLAMSAESSIALNSQFLIFEEPENSLHPSIQRDFIKVIKQYLPKNQIFFSTHSPYILKNHIGEAELIVGQKNGNEIFLHNPPMDNRLFSNISWGELSYYAYDLATFEYHNELYGWIQERTEKWSIMSVDNYLNEKGIKQDKVWIKQKKSGEKEQNVTIMTYIRNFTHHPENTLNKQYDEHELHQSITELREIAYDIRAENC